MRTPIGSVTAEMVFIETDEGLAGSAEGTTETVQLQDIHIVTDSSGEHVRWQQSITKPLRLNLDFDVLIVGDEMRGHSRAGRLPTSTVTGYRISDERRHQRQ